MREQEPCQGEAVVDVNAQQVFANVSKRYNRDLVIDPDVSDHAKRH